MKVFKTFFRHTSNSRLINHLHYAQPHHNRRTATTKTTTTAMSIINKNIFSLYFILVLFNLANTVLCNDVDVIVDSGQKYNHNNNEDDVAASSSQIKYANESLIEARELFEQSSGRVWSQFLEDYVLSQSPSNRKSKDIQFLNEMSGPGPGPHGHWSQMMVNSGMGPNPNAQPPLNYHSSAYKRPMNQPPLQPQIFINNRIGEAGVELEPHKRPPAVQVINPQFRPMANQATQHQQPGFLQQLFGMGGGGGGNAPTNSQQQIRPLPLQQQAHNGQQTFRAVSENDLYLLGAIEKLVYRVDYLESRVRRSEQLIYYLMAGNKQQTEVRDPCPANFTRISDNCYYINSYQKVDWKVANSACKGRNSHLAEFEKISENEEIMAYLLNQPAHRGRDFWLGGLNPGLLWIWTNSAKPVNPNMNLTSIAMAQQQKKDDETETNTIDVDEKDDKSQQILNNIVEIEGDGRCLRLSYNSSKHSYHYFGQDCTSRHHYICESEDKTLDNKIKKIARELKLFV